MAMVDSKILRILVAGHPRVTMGTGMTDPEDFEARTGIRLIPADELDSSAVTPELFALWRSPRRGGDHPERMDNPVWDWLIRTGVNAYQGNERFGGPSPFDAGPAWCFDRMGMPWVKLPDGRVVFIAGEHEDHYDPDFYIYNDVVVRHPDGRIEIFGYPEEDFPPTDFHTATLAGERIVLIGNLGYPKQRKAGVTQVAVLELETWRVRVVDCSGECPGWIHSHQAELAEDGRSITISRGLLDPVDGEDASLRENIDDWRLWLDEWRWERVTRRQWPRREVLRKDGKRLQLWELGQVFSPVRGMAGSDWLDQLTDDQLPGVNREEFRKLLQDGEEREAQTEARLRAEGLTVDEELLKSLFIPPVPHEPLESSEDEWGCHRFTVQGVTVRYNEDEWNIQLTVEGDLPPSLVDQLSGELLSRLERLQGAPCVMRVL